jgi:hypothetical protein
VKKIVGTKAFPSIKKVGDTVKGKPKEDLKIPIAKKEEEKKPSFIPSRILCRFL